MHARRPGTHILYELRLQTGKLLPGYPKAGRLPRVQLIFERRPVKVQAQRSQLSVALIYETFHVTKATLQLGRTPSVIVHGTLLGDRDTSG